MIPCAYLCAALAFSDGFQGAWFAVFRHAEVLPPITLTIRHGEPPSCEAFLSGYDAGAMVATRLLIEDMR